MIETLTLEQVKAYVESNEPTDLVGAPANGYYCLAAQTLRWLEKISDQDMEAVLIKEPNFTVHVREVPVEVEHSLIPVLDEFDDLEYKLDMTFVNDPSGEEVGWVTRAQLEASSVLPWLVGATEGARR